MVSQSWRATMPSTGEEGSRRSSSSVMFQGSLRWHWNSKLTERIGSLCRRFLDFRAFHTFCQGCSTQLGNTYFDIGSELAYAVSMNFWKLGGTESIIRSYKGLTSRA